MFEIWNAILTAGCYVVGALTFLIMLGFAIAPVALPFVVYRIYNAEHHHAPEPREAPHVGNFAHA